MSNKEKNKDSYGKLFSFWHERGEGNGEEVEGSGEEMIGSREEMKEEKQKVKCDSVLRHPEAIAEGSIVTNSFLNLDPSLRSG
ncbi:hypothetical protein KA405_02090 [Patescibacteria group bacterium]|nr:hypothetical protein [Patescibacteria group bacterium]